MNKFVRKKKKFKSYPCSEIKFHYSVSLNSRDMELIAFFFSVFIFREMFNLMIENI